MCSYCQKKPPKKQINKIHFRFIWSLKKIYFYVLVVEINVKNENIYIYIYQNCILMLAIMLLYFLYLIYFNRSYLAIPASSWVDDFIDWLNPQSRCCRLYSFGPNAGSFCPASECGYQLTTHSGKMCRILSCNHVGV